MAVICKAGGVKLLAHVELKVRDMKQINRTALVGFIQPSADAIDISDQIIQQSSRNRVYWANRINKI